MEELSVQKNRVIDNCWLMSEEQVKPKFSFRRNVDEGIEDLVGD